MKNLEIHEVHPNSVNVRQSCNQVLNNKKCVIRKIKEIKKAHHAPWLSKEHVEVVVRKRLALKNVQRYFAQDEAL
jgi:hypothetical protein